MAAVLAVATICIKDRRASGVVGHNLFTTVSDMFPKKAVSSVARHRDRWPDGIGGVIIKLLAEPVLRTLSNRPRRPNATSIMFTICALSYLMAWAIMKILVPRHEPIS